MKHFSNPIRRSLAALCAAALLCPTVSAAEQAALEMETELVEGLTYTQTAYGPESRREEYLLEYDPDGDAKAIFLPADGTVYGAASVSSAVKYAESQGYHVLAALNTDFFSSTTGVALGLMIRDGEYLSGAEDEGAILIDKKGDFDYVPAPEIALTLRNQTSGETITPDHFNKYRAATGGTYLINDQFSTVSTRTEGSGWFVLLRQLGEPEALTVESDIQLEVIEKFDYGSSIVIREGEYILTADDRSNCRSIYDSFSVGDRVRLSTSCDDRTLRNAKWASGCGDLIVEDGDITDSHTWDFRTDGRNPRTALGVKRDGTVFLFAVDGRRSGWSGGMTEMELAEAMEDMGCDWAVNLDGGGSTTMSVLLPGKELSSTQNRPSDGSERRCANFLLLVTEEEPGRERRSALTKDHLVVLADTTLPLPGLATTDRYLHLLDAEPEDVSISPRLGDVEDGVYTAPRKGGTDTLKLKANGVSGTATIHVVEELTELTVTANGKTKDKWTLQPGEALTFGAAGKYLGRTALYDASALTWEMEGDIGTLEGSTLTAGDQDAKGSVFVTAGGITKTISITVDRPKVSVPIAEGHWASSAVDYANGQEMLYGVDVSSFDWDAPITRAQFVLSLHNVLGRPAPAAPTTFTDVAESDAFYAALSWGEALGIAGGVGEGRFAPHNTLTREQAFTLLRRALPQLNITCQDAHLSTLNQYRDAQTISDYAKGHIATLTIQGLVNGSDGAMNPKGQLTWAQTAALMQRLSTFVPVTADPATSAVTAVCRISEGVLNVREAPEGAVIGKLQPEEQVVVLSVQEGWVQVFYTTEEGTLLRGYASADFLEVSGDITPLPPAE